MYTEKSAHRSENELGGQQPNKVEKVCPKKLQHRIQLGFEDILILSVKAFLHIDSANFDNGIATSQYTPVVKVVHGSMGTR